MIPFEYLVLKHFYLPLSEFIIFYFLQRPFLFCILFIASYIFVRFIFHSYNFINIHLLISYFPIFQFQYFSAPSFPYFIFVFIFHLYHSLFTIILIIRFPLCILNMQISFPTQQPFTANLFLPQSQSHLEITFNRYQTCLYPSTLKQGNKIKLEKVQTLSPF